MIISYRMRQARYTAHMGVRRNAHRNSAESLKATDLMEELGVHICTVLKWILKTEDRIHHLVQYRVVAGSYKHCSEHLRAIKLANFLTI